MKPLVVFFFALVSGSLGFGNQFGRPQYSSFVAGPSSGYMYPNYYAGRSAAAPRLYNPYEYNYNQEEMPALSYFKGHETQILRQSQFQAAVLAEQFLSKHFTDGCFERGFCEIASEHNLEDTKMLEQQAAVEATIRMLEGLLPELETANDDALPHVRRLVAAHSVGQQTHNGQLCQWLFKCEKENMRLLQEKQTGIQPRTTCEKAAKYCPGIAVGCGLCAITMPDKCAVICPVTAIYCGSAGIICNKRKEEETTTTTTTTEAPEETSTTEATTTTTTVAPVPSSTDDTPRRRAKEALEQELLHRAQMAIPNKERVAELLQNEE